MGYRDNIPHMDTWVLARPKLRDPGTGEKEQYYGAFPSGFLERAVDLLGVSYASRVLHVCGGRVRSYHSGPTPGGPGGRGLGPLHRTLDLDGSLFPDFAMDARQLGVGPGDLFPFMDADLTCSVQPVREVWAPPAAALWDAALIDRPYSEEDARNYIPGPSNWPASLNDLLKRTLQVVRPGGRVGVLDYVWPQPPRDMDTALLALVNVGMGWNNRARYYTVYERVPTDAEKVELEQAAARAYAAALGAPALTQADRRNIVAAAGNILASSGQSRFDTSRDLFLPGADQEQTQAIASAVGYNEAPDAALEGFA